MRSAWVSKSKLFQKQPEPCIVKKVELPKLGAWKNQLRVRVTCDALGFRLGPTSTKVPVASTRLQVQNISIHCIPSPRQQHLRTTETMDSFEDISDDSPPAIDPYEVLGLERTASTSDIKSAYRKAALKHHPGTSIPVATNMGTS